MNHELEFARCPWNGACSKEMPWDSELFRSEDFLVNLRVLMMLLMSKAPKTIGRHTEIRATLHSTWAQ